ncbi:MAG: glycosyltransferase family 4 protein [Bacteroidetes bacterium]|nr:glycosyltransferase family 4 protein [Bacteroidota bacterium]
MKKVLLLTDVNFWEDSSGHRARIKALIRYLSSRVCLTVINTGPAPESITGLLKEKYGAEFFVLENTKILSSAGYGRRLKKLLGDREFDSVIIEYIHSSYFLNYLNGDPQIILDAHDIISDRAEEFKKFNYAGALYEIPKETEFEILEVYDHVMVLCAPDHEKLAQVFGREKILLCPHPVASVHHHMRREVKKISYVASAYIPNRDAINEFITRCWPLISEEFPEVRLCIYGTICGAVAMQGFDNIMLKGFVPSLDHIYKEADIVINPIRFGAGLKIKNVEALAYGVPLVTTAHGARGLERGKNNAFLVADGPTAFVNAVKYLISNKNRRQALSDSAHTFIAETFSEKMCFEPLIKILTKGQ